MKEESSQSNQIYLNKAIILHFLEKNGKYETDTTLIIKQVNNDFNKNDNNSEMYIIKIFEKTNKEKIIFIGIINNNFKREGLCINNYANGDNEKADETVGVTGILPFALNNASDNNPDLIFEIDKHLAILFEDQKNTGEYTSMINKIKSIAIDARSVGSRGESKARCYIELKEYQYKYLEVLKTYVPKLLEKEEFFNSVFQ